MSLSRRHLLSVLPGAAVLAAVPALAIAGDDPLFALILRWRAQARAVANVMPPAPTALIDPWLATERAMIGVRPTTAAGAIAALAEVRDYVDGFVDDPMTRWLAEASHDFLAGA